MEGRSAGRRAARVALHGVVRVAAAALLALLSALAIAAPSLASPAGGGLGGATPFASSPPKVVAQPQSQTVEAGQSVSFTSTATGSPEPTVQWQHSADNGATWQAIEGATATTYTIAHVAASENGYQFRAVFTNSAGEATSKTATLTVRAKPAITKQPQSETVEEGHTATFEAAATGLPAPTVQWQVEAPGASSYKSITGATSTTLNVANVKLAESGSKYRALFKNIVGESVTEAATLTVQVAPKVTKQPANATVNEGGFAIFEASASGTPTPTTQWEQSTDGGSTWEAIEGQTFASLLVSHVTPSMTGYEYRARFTNAAGSVTSNAATLTVQSTPVATAQPEDATTLVGGTVTFEAAAKGIPTPTVQWQYSSDGGATWNPIGGATTNKLTVSEAQLSENNRLFRAAFTNEVGTGYSAAARLTVTSTDFAAYGWGLNTHGEVGIGSSESTIEAPRSISKPGFVTAVAAGNRHSLALLAGGTVWSWGYNAEGQLGVFESFGTNSPIEVKHLKRVTAIAAGGNHSMALLENGTVMDWGENEAGELGNGKTTLSETPVEVKGITNAVAIAAGKEHSLALLADGTVMAWGSNERGQLGNASHTSSDVPVEVKDLSGVKAIAAGARYSLALLESGTVVAWGDDQAAQLGNATLSQHLFEGSEEEEEEALQSTLPIEVEGLTGVKALAAGNTHALALLEGGTVVGWGEDAEGEVGNGAIENHVLSPVPVSGLSGVTQIVAGNLDSAALLSSGAVMTWGSNNFGNLGVGTSGGNSDVPVTLHGPGRLSGIAAGGSHMLAFGESVPSVSGVSPAAGPLAGANTVTISGVNLGGVTSVHFGAAAATEVTPTSPSTVTAKAPAGTGKVDVTVTSSAGTSAVVAADRYSYRPVPTLSKLSVKTGPATGGTSVTITGNELNGVSAVTVGGVPATEFTVESPISMTAVMPANVGGTAYVQVTGPGGTSATTTKARFKYTPVIESVTPAFGPLAGGTGVVIQGAGFSTVPGADLFKFGKGKAATVECTSQTTCNVVAPAAKAAGTVNIQATVGKAKSVTGSGDLFTYEG